MTGAEALKHTAPGRCGPVLKPPKAGWAARSTGMGIRLALHRNCACGGSARSGGNGRYGLAKGIGQALRALGGLAQRGLELVWRRNQAFGSAAVGLIRAHV